MPRITAFVLAGFILLSITGCRWMVESMFDGLIGEKIPKDGRDLDANGLTDRDKRARFEENYQREFLRQSKVK